MLILRLFDIELTEPKPSEKECHEYEYALFNLSPEIYDDSSKHTPAIITNIYATNDNNVQDESTENMEIHLPLSTKKLIDMQNNGTFCATMLQLRNEKMSAERYFSDDKTVLHRIVREDDKLFYTLVVLQTLIKYVLRHNCTVRTYQYLK